MTMYTPDRWVVIELQSEEDTHQRVFAGWYGGYAGADSWKMNSGIVKTEDHGDYYDFHGHSGSVYRCYKNAYGMSMYMQSVYHNFKLQEKDNLKLSIVEGYDEDQK